MKDKKNFSLRISAEKLGKLRYICKYEERSANSQILMYITAGIRAFEVEHGEIKQNMEFGE